MWTEGRPKSYPLFFRLNLDNLRIVMFRLVLAFVLFCIAAAQIPCDDTYGAHCPEHISWAVGDCVKNHEYSDECGAFMAMSDTCHADIDKHCTGKEYTGELITCLTEHTKPEDLSEECIAALPKKEAKKEKRKRTKEEVAKANKRRRTRLAAARTAREMNGDL
jgi:hypothetical protein